MPLSVFFFTQVANDKAEHLPVPFDITTFSSTPTIAARPHKRDLVPIAICSSPVINFVSPPKHSVSALSSISLRTTVTLIRNLKIGGCKQGVLQEMCKWGMLFSKSGVCNPGQTPRDSKSITAVLCVSQVLS